MDDGKIRDEWLALFEERYETLRRDRRFREKEDKLKDFTDEIARMLEEGTSERKKPRKKKYAG